MVIRSPTFDCVIKVGESCKSVRWRILSSNYNNLGIWSVQFISMHRVTLFKGTLNVLSYQYQIAMVTARDRTSWRFKKCRQSICALLYLNSLWLYLPLVLKENWMSFNIEENTVHLKNKSVNSKSLDLRCIYNSCPVIGFLHLIVVSTNQYIYTPYK